MNKTKSLIIIGTALVLVGLIIFLGVMSAINWDFSRLSTNKFQTATFEITDNFENVSITTNTADISFERSTDNKCKVVCYEHQTQPHTVNVQNGTLFVNVTDTRKWYEYIGINFSTPKITVYLPQTKYSALLIKESTGDVKIQNGFEFEKVDISLSTGDVYFNGAVSQNVIISLSTGDVTVNGSTCSGDFQVNVTTGDVEVKNLKSKNFSSNGNTGDIKLEDVIIGENMLIKRTTGDVYIQRCDAKNILITTDTGDVKGSLLTEKIFLTHTDTGFVNVPQTTSGGKCEITTDTGDIKISIE